MTLEPKVKNETSADHPSTSLSSHSTFSPLLLYISLLLAPSLCISVATARGPRRSSGGRIPTGRSACPRTSSRRSDWSGWWRRPRGSPALRRSRAQSHTAPCSSAVPGLKTTSKQSRDEEDGRIFEKVKGHRLSVPGKASHIKHQYNIRKRCSRDVLNRLKHKELPLTAAFQDQILPLALCDLTEISSSEEAPCTDKLGFFSATQFSHCIWLNPQTAGKARDGKRFGQPFSGLHLFTRAATQTINGKGPTASYIYNPKKKVLISRESDQMNSPSPSYFFLFVIQAWNSFTTIWAHVFTVKRSHTDTQMIKDARCTVQNNDEWKKNKSKWRQMSKKKLQKKISNTEHTAETLKLCRTRLI